MAIRITKVYTRGGDAGETSLGGGRRAPKDALRIEVYGTVDELNSQIGVALATPIDAALDVELRRIQNELFHLGADLCTPEEDKAKMPVPAIEGRHVEALENLMDRLTAEGLVIREPSREDRRKVELRLSARGRQLLARLAGMHRKELERIGPTLKRLIAEAARLKPGT